MCVLRKVFSLLVIMIFFQSCNGSKLELKKIVLDDKIIVTFELNEEKNEIISGINGKPNVTISSPNKSQKILGFEIASFAENGICLVVKSKTSINECSYYWVTCWVKDGELRTAMGERPDPILVSGMANKPNMKIINIRNTKGDTLEINFSNDKRTTSDNFTGYKFVHTCAVYMSDGSLYKVQGKTEKLVFDPLDHLELSAVGSRASQQGVDNQNPSKSKKEDKKTK